MSEVEHKLDQLFCNAFSTHHPAMIDWVRVKFELKTLRAQLAEAQKEAFPAYKREKALRCKAEAENAALRARLKGVEEVYKKYKPFFNVNSAECELWQAIKAACEEK